MIDKVLREIKGSVWAIQEKRDAWSFEICEFVKFTIICNQKSTLNIRVIEKQGFNEKFMSRTLNISF